MADGSSQFIVHINPKWYVHGWNTICVCFECKLRYVTALTQQEKHPFRIVQSINVEFHCQVADLRNEMVVENIILCLVQTAYEIFVD